MITNLCLESAPERFDEFCGLLAAVHNEEISRNDKSAHLARVAMPKSKTKAVTLSETVQQVAASNGQHSIKPDGQSLQKTLTDVLVLQTEAVITSIKALGLGHGNEETIEEKPIEIRAAFMEKTRYLMNIAHTKFKISRQSL